MLSYPRTSLGAGLNDAGIDSSRDLQCIQKKKKKVSLIFFSLLYNPFGIVNPTVMEV